MDDYLDNICTKFTDPGLRERILGGASGAEILRRQIMMRKIFACCQMVRVLPKSEQDLSRR